MGETRRPYIIEINDEIQRHKKLHSDEFNAKDISDGYHTFEELYEHRMALNAALCTMIKNFITMAKMAKMAKMEPTIDCYKSKLHSDGTMFEDYFIVVIEATTFGQVSYHYHIDNWDKFDIEEKEKANEYDGYTSRDCIERLLSLSK